MSKKVFLKLLKKLLCINQSRKYVLFILLISINVFGTYYFIYQHDTKARDLIVRKTKILATEDANKKTSEEPQSHKIRRRLSSRLNHIKNMCNEMNNTSPLQFDVIEREAWPWIYVSHKYKLLYCQTPKVGSTHWLNLFGVLEERLNGTLNREIHGARLMMLSYLIPEERNRVLEEYTKFMVIREPFKRLLSAYKDKLLPYKGHDFALFYYLSQKLIYYYRSENSTVNKKYPTLEELIEYITDFSKYATQIKSHYSEKRHWKPQTDLCYPCNIKYEFVLDIDYIEEEADYFFKAVGIPKALKYPENKKESNLKDTLPNSVFDVEATSYFSNVKRELLKALYLYYEKDYKVFGFETPPQFD